VMRPRSRGTSVCVVKAYREKYYPRGLSVWVSTWWFTLFWADKTGRVYSGETRDFLSQDAEAQRAEIWSCIHGGPMKRKERAKLTGGLVHASDDRMAKAYPRLHEWMTAARYDDGDENRESPTLTLWAQGGQFRLSLRDRAEELVMWLVGDTVLEVLKLAEAFCQDEAGPWRVDDHSSPHNGKRLRKS